MLGKPRVHEEAAVKTADVIDRLREGLASLRAQRPRVEASAPFPISGNILHNAPEAVWYPPEVLAHLTEMLPFWFGECERILAGDGSEPVPFGRVADNELRIGVIARDRTLPLRELYARVDSLVERAIARLGELSDADRVVARSRAVFIAIDPSVFGVGAVPTS